jgi:two-component system, chemotaxis family, protein-glutamate methylesterase/glutaminase
MAQRDIIVIGASMGGVEAIIRLAKELPADLAAAVFVVVHVAADSANMLGTILDRVSPLEATVAEDGEPIRHGRIYVAPSDHHMLLEMDRVRVVRGPRENRTRPAIDPLFRSAAAAYGPRVIGVILTGWLDDGSAGLLAIKRSHGTAVVQDPADAVHPSMPEHALAQVDVDYRLPLDEIASLLSELVQQPTPAALVADLADVALEVKMVKGGGNNPAVPESIGELAPVTCPDCGGSLWRVNANDANPRYRCHVGHGFTVRALLASQDEALEQSLWAALRALQEKIQTLSTVAEVEQEQGKAEQAQAYLRQVAETRRHLKLIRELLSIG